MIGLDLLGAASTVSNAPAPTSADLLGVGPYADARDYDDGLVDGKRAMVQAIARGEVPPERGAKADVAVETIVQRLTKGKSPKYTEGFKIGIKAVGYEAWVVHEKQKETKKITYAIAGTVAAVVIGGLYFFLRGGKTAEKESAA